MDENQILKRIVECEYAMFLAIRNGHKPFIGDEYQFMRTEVNVLRCLYYGEDSKFCRK